MSDAIVTARPGSTTLFNEELEIVDPFVWEDFPPKVMVVCVYVCSLLGLSIVFPLMPNNFCKTLTSPQLPLSHSGFLGGGALVEVLNPCRL